MKSSLSSIIRQPKATRAMTRTFFHFIFTLLFLFVLAAVSFAQTTARRTTLAVLDFGETETGGRAADKLWQTIMSEKEFQLSDREEAQAAARGHGYAGSLNMTLMEARELGASVGADFFITGDAQTLRRSPSTGDSYYEAYASIFLVSSRTGRLIMWERPSYQAATPDSALEILLRELGGGAIRYRMTIAIQRAL